MPLVVVLALVIGGVTGTGSKSGSMSPSTAPAAGPVTVPAPLANPAADRPCTALIQKLPPTLDSSTGPLPARPAFSDSPYVAAWGDPAIVLRCGVPRPAELTPGSSDYLVGVDGVYFLPKKQGKATVFTTVDRPAYVEVTVPPQHEKLLLLPIAKAVAAAMPPVCEVSDTELDVSKLCTHRP